MSIAKNSFFNIAGYLIPGLLSVPILGYMARELGIEEFGLFTLILSIVGYASIFDIGITRSVIREIAIYKHNKQEIIKILSTSTLIILLLGVLAAFLIIMFNTQITNLLKVSTNIKEEFNRCLIIMSLSIPSFLVTQVWCSLLEGKEEFLKLNIYKSISSTLVILLPAIGLFWGHSLTYVIIGLLISRFISMFLIFQFCKGYRFVIKFDKLVFSRLITFGGWIAVSNIVSPIMSYFDRFILANRMGSDIVGFYTGPSEAIARIGIFPSAIARTIFPMLSSNRVDSFKIKRYSYILIIISVVPFALFFAGFAEEILTIWLGDSFASKSSLVFQILTLGLMFNSIAQVPFASIQASGNSKVTALLHLIECLPYLILLWWLITNYGIVGAAWAWTIRMFVDMILLITMDNIKNVKKIIFKDSRI